MPPRKPPGKHSAASKATPSASAAAAESSNRPTRASREDPPPVKSSKTRGRAPVQTEATDEGNGQRDDPRSEVEPEIFESFFPELNLSDYMLQLDKWPLARLKKCLAQAKNRRRNRPPPEIVAAAKGLVRDREKVVIMLALIGGCREGLIRKEL